MPASAARATDRPKHRFGVFEFDPCVPELCKLGVRLKLPQQPLEILAELLEHPGELVSRDALQKRLWPQGTFVDFEQSLNKAVNKLRESLGDSADHPLYIETVPRRGYRFVAPLERGPPASAVAPPVSRRWWWMAGFAGALCVALVTGLWPVTPPRTRVRQLTADSSRKDQRLVVAHGKVRYTAGFRLQTGLWAVPTAGGSPQHLRSPCAGPRESPYLIGASGDHERILVGCVDASPSDQTLWVVGFDGDPAQSAGRLPRADIGVSVSPDLSTLAVTR